MAEQVAKAGLNKRPASPYAVGEAHIRVAQWVGDSIVDGPGLRLTLFAQGCPHRCPGCHNPQTFLPLGGQVMAVSEILAEYQKNELLEGMTFSGGEPFVQAKALSLLAKEVHALGGNIVCYTGYTLETLQAAAQGEPIQLRQGPKLALLGQGQEAIAALLQEVDLLIDGPYVASLRSLDLPFRGSRNQRLLALSEEGEALLARVPTA